MKNQAFLLKFSIFSFVIVAILGVLMRYKIAFSLPFVEQKHLQEAHSHFAFYGFITSCIYILVAQYLSKTVEGIQMKKYQILIGINFFASYGMLLSFLYAGYFWLSIIFSTIALLNSFVYYFFLHRDLKNLQETSKIWFLAAFFFAVLSSLGVFTLSYMMSTKNVVQELYLASTYFYLHFQYNGFFIFSCLGLLFYHLKEKGILISSTESKMIFWLLFIGCFIGFGLSVLWLKLPVWIYLVIVLATLVQTYGVFLFFKWIKNQWPKIKTTTNPLQRFVFIYVGFAFVVKILLQLGSVIPAVSQFAFGFRNVVIAYLHLILLMCVATFLLSQVIQNFKTSPRLNTGLKYFLLSVFLNEFLLGLMGIFSIKYVAIPFANEFLFGISLLILISILIIFNTLKEKSN